MADPGKRAGTEATELMRQGKTDTTNEDPPSPSYVAWFHSLAPTRDPRDIHHRLGTQAWEAAGGSHKHRGDDNSQTLFDGEVIAGDLSTDAGIRQAVKDIAQLLASLGATDSTTG